MQIADNTVFQGTASAYGAWIDISHLSGWSLHVMGLETGGSIKVYTSDEPFAPTKDVADAEAYLLTTITATAGVAMYQGVGIAHWLQIQKVAGGGPTATIVDIFGQIEF